MVFTNFFQEKQRSVNDIFFNFNAMQVDINKENIKSPLLTPLKNKTKFHNKIENKDIYCIMILKE